MSTASAVDGRHRRSERSRAAVVDAMLALFEEGELQPRAARIAEVAGLSERSVFRHFDDLEELAATAIERHSSRIVTVFVAPSAAGDRAARVSALVDQRLAIHDRVAMVARAGALLASSSPTVARALEQRRRYLDAQVATHFAVDVAGLDEPARTQRLAALAAVATLEAVDNLRAVSGLTRDATRCVLVRTLEALLPAAGATLPEGP